MVYIDFQQVDDVERYNDTQLLAQRLERNRKFGGCLSFVALNMSINTPDDPPLGRWVLVVLSY